MCGRLADANADAAATSPAYPLRSLLPPRPAINPADRPRLPVPPCQVNPEEERLAKWTMCQLTGQPLTPPCVVDELGNLFNKDAVIQVGYCQNGDGSS